MDSKRPVLSKKIAKSLISTLLVPPPEFEVVASCGVVTGVTVRSRNAIASIGAGFVSLLGGRNDILRALCVDARVEAYNLMVEEAVNLGANCILGMHYDACEVAEGITEMVCYGTAVQVKPKKAGQVKAKTAV